ncbi:MAG: metallophosphoesterase [Anaerolineaceae bacterium]
MSSTYYAIPDIHGRKDLLDKALNFIYRGNPGGGKIIFTGDYIDRGPDSREVLLTVMNPPEGWEFIALTGNHEELFVQNYLSKTRFYDFNTFKNLAGLGEFDPPLQYDQVHDLIPQQLIEWMYHLPLYHLEDELNIFAHAWWGPNPTRHTACWTRKGSEEPFEAPGGYFLTHGHTIEKDGPVRAPNRINLDCGAFKYGRLVIAQYEKGVRGPVGIHEFV